jgi:hypothetical protein
VEDADYTEEDRSFVVMEYRRYLHALPRPYVAASYFRSGR